MLKCSGQTIGDDMKKLLFLNGINPQHSYIIRAQSPTTVEDIIKIAKQLEIGSQPFIAQQPQQPTSNNNPMGFGLGGFQPFPLMPQQQIQQTTSIPGFPNAENVEKKNDAVTKKDIDDITDKLQQMSIAFIKTNRNQQSRPVYNYNQRNDQNRNYVKPNVTCHNCERHGHYARDCRSQPKQFGVRINTCFACNQLGHIAKDCPNRIQPQPLNNN